MSPYVDFDCYNIRFWVVSEPAKKRVNESDVEVHVNGFTTSGPT